MAKIKIENLPRNMKISAEEMRYVVGGQAGGLNYPLMEASGSVGEMQPPLNLQYLTLQNKISQENRQYSMVSNVMKVKHDTAKSAINNIR
jgi:hypothetical protein